jgi:hypothetical protein
MRLAGLSYYVSAKTRVRSCSGPKLRPEVAFLILPASMEEPEVKLGGGELSERDESVAEAERG